MELLRKTCAEINLDALKHNVEVAQTALRDGVEMMAVVKADAYGHGAAIFCRYLMEYGVRRFAVAALNEAVELRLALPDAEVLVLGVTPDELLPVVAQHRITQTVYTFRQAKILSDFGVGAKIHLKLDTGMNRLGYMPCEESLDEIERIFALPSLEVEGIFSHLALADREHDLGQFHLFTEFTDAMAARGLRVRFRHICDGIAMVRYPEMQLDMVRPGGVLYGFNASLPVRPVMTFKSSIVRVHTVPAGAGVGYDMLDPADHERVIATLPYGYSDGAPRAMSCGKGYVTVHGQRAPYIGLLCMDMCMVDVTGIENVCEGDEVVIFGSGENDMTFPEAARICGYNRNGVQSGIARRVPRVYLRGGEVLCERDYLL